MELHNEEQKGHGQVTKSTICNVKLWREKRGAEGEDKERRNAPARL